MNTQECGVICPLQKKKTFVFITGDRVKPYSPEIANGSCTDHNLVMPKEDQLSPLLMSMHPELFPGGNVPDASIGKYFCTVNSDPVFDPAVLAPFQSGMALRDGAVPGTYIISYHTTDRAGNPSFGGENCPDVKIVTRKVIVGDSLPPVISIYLKNKLVHKSNGGPNGDRSKEWMNPASYEKFNPFLSTSLMVENTNMNKFSTLWLGSTFAICAVGLVLLAWNSRSDATAIDIEV